MQPPVPVIANVMVHQNSLPRFAMRHGRRAKSSRMQLVSSFCFLNIRRTTEPHTKVSPSSQLNVLRTPRTTHLRRKNLPGLPEQAHSNTGPGRSHRSQPSRMPRCTTPPACPAPEARPAQGHAPGPNLSPPVRRRAKSPAPPSSPSSPLRLQHLL